MSQLDETFFYSSESIAFLYFLLQLAQKSRELDASPDIRKIRVPHFRTTTTCTIARFGMTCPSSRGYSSRFQSSWGVTMLSMSS